MKLFMISLCLLLLLGSLTVALAGRDYYKILGLKKTVCFHPIQTRRSNQTSNICSFNIYRQRKRKSKELTTKWL